MKHANLIKTRKYLTIIVFLFSCCNLCPTQSALAQSSIGPFSPRTSNALAPRSKDEQQVIDAYRETNKAVVHINTRLANYDFFFGMEYQEGMGSGVVVDSKNGLVITNYHVIKGSDRISVTLSGGKTYPAIRVGFDQENDIALIQIIDPPKNLVTAQLGTSESLAVGQRVLAIGNPFGLDRTLTTGIISSLGRTIELRRGQLMDNLIQTDAAINQGNSGGPLMDSMGRVIGLNTFILSKTGESAGIGFAIPIDQIKQVIPQLIKYGRVLRPKIGVSLRETEVGLLVLYVQPNGPAAKVGIKGALKTVKRGPYIGNYIDPADADYILAVNGQKVRSKGRALELITKTPPGRKTELTIRRGLVRRNVATIEVKPILD